MAPMTCNDEAASFFSELTTSQICDIMGEAPPPHRTPFHRVCSVMLAHTIADAMVHKDPAIRMEAYDWIFGNDECALPIEKVCDVLEFEVTMVRKALQKLLATEDLQRRAQALRDLVSVLHALGDLPHDDPTTG